MVAIKFHKFYSITNKLLWFLLFAFVRPALTLL